MLMVVLYEWCGCHVRCGVRCVYVREECCVNRMFCVLPAMHLPSNSGDGDAIGVVTVVTWLQV